jgi:hypothetical protein
MKSNLVIGAILVAAILAMHTGGLQGVACGQSEVAAMPVVQDAFTDNRRGAIWGLYEDDATKCKITETNGRLEMTSTASSYDSFAGYFSSGWWLKTTSDFAMKVDLHFDPKLSSPSSAWVLFGVSPDGQKPREHCVTLGIGSVTSMTYYRYEMKESTVVRPGYAGRDKQRVTLFISYSAANDELYLSDSGYGPNHAWETYQGLVWGEWYTERLYVLLGGLASETVIVSGNAHLDNFVVEQGVVGGIVPTDPSKPTQPTDPTDPGETPQDIVAPVAVIPTVIKRSDAAGSLTAATTLPKGIRASDVKKTELLLLTPGEIEATAQGTHVWINGQVIVWGTFNKVELLDAVADTGVVNLQLTGWLKDGRKFTGVCPITIQ